MATVLIVGSGSREHALAETFARSPQVEHVYVAPGNPGMVADKIHPVAIETNNQAALVAFAKEKAISLTLVGSEAPLVAGLVDAFEDQGLAIFGPRKAAARLEGSKAFMKKLVLEEHIPTAQAVTVHDEAAAQQAVSSLGWPVVVKQDGLAAGKGVTILDDEVSSQTFLHRLYQVDAQTSLVIEEYLEGHEFSLFSLVGKEQVIHTPVAQDHKRRFDGDQGPNTGGMGAYSPVPFVQQAMVQEAVDQLVTPLLAAMKAAGCPYQGVLYTGVMLTAGGPKVIEYNVRFGDPEAQVVLPQLKSDFYELIQGLLQGKQVQPEWQKDQTYLGVVLVNPTYPKPADQMFVLSDLAATGLRVNYGGVALKAGQLVSQGGRVATLVAGARNLAQAQAEVYRALTDQVLPLAYRHDIGQQGLVVKRVDEF